MVEVGIEKLELEPVGQAVDRPGLGVRFVAAHDEAANFLLPIGKTVGIAQRRQIRREAREQSDVEGENDHRLGACFVQRSAGARVQLCAGCVLDRGRPTG